jgi:hypothetical protein
MHIQISGDLHVLWLLRFLLLVELHISALSDAAAGHNKGHRRHISVQYIQGLGL